MSVYIPIMIMMRVTMTSRTTDVNKYPRDDRMMGYH